MKKAENAPLAGEQLVKEIVTALEEALAENIRVIDLQSRHPKDDTVNPADYFVICQCDTTVHNRASADSVLDRLRKLGCKPWKNEGLDEGRWILLDFSDVVVHVMLAELREYYNIEELWSSNKKAGSRAARSRT